IIAVRIRARARSRGGTRIAVRVLSQGDRTEAANSEGENRCNGDLFQHEQSASDGLADRCAPSSPPRRPTVYPSYNTVCQGGSRRRSGASKEARIEGHLFMADNPDFRIESFLDTQPFAIGPTAAFSLKATAGRRCRNNFTSIDRRLTSVSFWHVA